MITAASLKSQTAKDLAAMAKRKGIAGWHSMRKDELVKALVKESKSTGGGKGKTKGKSSPKPTKSRRAAASTSSPKSSPSKSSPAKSASSKSSAKAVAKKTATRKTAAKPRSGSVASKAKSSPKSQAATKGSSAKSAGTKKVAAKKPAARKKPEAPKRKVSTRTIRKIQEAHELRGRKRDLAGKTTTSGARTKAQRDRCVLLVRDSYWLQAYWEISRETVERAKVALAEHWHTAAPMLRLSEIDDNSTTSTTERLVREIPIHGGVSNWYIDVVDPPKTYRIALGYKTGNGKFHILAKSNKVSTPVPGSADSVDGNWSDIADNCEKIFALSGGYNPDNADSELKELFEERLRRPMGSPTVTQYGAGADGSLIRQRDFDFVVDAEMIIFGQTDSNAYVTLGGEPVKLRNDGSFTVRLALPDRRQVLPIVASSADGVEQRTTVLAVERNTKVMEPLIKEGSDQ